MGGNCSTTPVTHVPAAPAHSDLLQHAADAQGLSLDVARLTADFARSPHSTTRAGRAILAHLARAATMSSNAAPHFAETAETALSLPRPAEATDRHYRDNRMVIDHATARAYLPRASESLRDAARELNDHLALHRFFPEPSRQQNPEPPPGRSARHR